MGKALSGLTKVVFIERWPYYRVATIDRFHCSSNNVLQSCTFTIHACTYATDSRAAL